MANPYGQTGSLSQLVESAGAIQAAGIEQSITGFSQSYEAAQKKKQDEFDANYLLKTASQMDADYTRIAAQHEDDPAAFQQAWGEYSSKQIEAAPSTIQMRIKQEVASYGMQGTRAAAKAFTDKNEVKQKADLYAFNNAQSSSVFQAFRDGDEKKAIGLMGEMLVANQKFGATPLEIEKLKLNLADTGRLQVVTGATERAYEAAGIEGLELLREETLKSKDFDDPRIRDKGIEIIDRQIAAAQREQAAKQKEVDNNIKAQKVVVGRKIGAMTDLLSLGYKPSKVELQQLSDFALVNDMQTEQNKINQSFRAYDFSLLTPLQRQSQIDKTTDSETKANLLKVNRQLNSLERDNPLEHLSRQGIIGIESIDVNDPVSWQTRAGMAEQAKEHLGRSVGMLTTEERNLFNTQWQQAPARQKLGMIAVMGQGLGEELPTTMNDLVKDGNTQIAMVTQLVMDGVPQVAEQVLLGQEVLKEDKTLQPKAVDLSMQINTMLGNAYQGSPAQRAAVKEAALNIYASASYKEGDHSQVLNKDRLDAAINQVTGGLIEYSTGGFWGIGSTTNTIEPPVRGMGEDKFTEWVQSITPEQVTKMSIDSKIEPAYGPEQIVKWIKEGAQLRSIRVANSAQPVYIIETSLGVVTDKTGAKPFYLTYSD